MVLFKKTYNLTKWLDIQRQAGKSIGFVPTMGALHAGHLSLLNESIKQNDVTLCSIYINPTQFNDPNDFEKYPVTLEADIELLANAGCTALFLPSTDEIYPNGIAVTGNQYNLDFLEKILEGHYRPGHFQGVCRVVHRLLDIVNPDRLYLGQKDYQQCMVIKKLLQLIGKEKSIHVKICPTVREKNGLAMSSRNVWLSGEERKKAGMIYQCLLQLKEELYPGGELYLLKQKAAFKLTNEGFRVDYVEIADADTLSPVNVWNGPQKLVALIAASLNEVRLIDNMIITD